VKLDREGTAKATAQQAAVVVEATAAATAVVA